MSNDKPSRKTEQGILAANTGPTTFEGLHQTNRHGAEYWSARTLQPHLGYSQWRRFEQAIERARASCTQSGNDPANHFAGAGKMVEIGSSGVREISDFHLSRFACYLIAQNGDPRKPEIAQAQKYFAIQTRRQEISDQIAADRERLELRKQTAEEFKMLSGAALQAGCLAFFTMPAIKIFMAASAARKSRIENGLPLRKTTG